MSLDDDFAFMEEVAADSLAVRARWMVLIVDDEPDVHQATLLALKGLLIEERMLEFVHANSAVEARDLLGQFGDIAVVILDVVMETGDAGLKLVHYIREELNNKSVRIILRTGQPGYAPEIDTIRALDINDYKTKADMTRARLFTSMTTAIRSYSQIHQLEQSRRGLEIIVKASAEFIKPLGIQLLANGVLTQLCALLGVGKQGIICVAKVSNGQDAVVVAAAGSYSDWIGKPLHAFPVDDVRSELVKVLGTRSHQIGSSTCLYFSSSEGNALAAFIHVDREISEIDRTLLQVFSTNIAVAFDNVELYQKVSDLAYVDALVGLPNRNALLRFLELAQGDDINLALVDIDGFADVNSVLDQRFGDAVLVAVATRLRNFVSPEVVVARIGGDVFALLGSSDQVNPENIAQMFGNPFEVGDEGLRLSATAGLVQLQQTSRNGVELLRNASTALKEGKSFNRGKSLYFDPAYASAARDRILLLSSLRQAFSQERLYVVYQPFVELATGELVGAEALLRWRNTDGTFVPPDRFIPIAEQSGLMVPIGDWVMSTALMFASQLKGHVRSDFRIAINISHVQFREPDFVEKLCAALLRHGVHPENVEIELTESVAVDDIELIEQKLAIIRSHGIAVAIDDFGTGYSSLNIIRQLRVNRLKIDRAFVSGDSCQSDNFGIAEMIHDLAVHLGLETIAEGIETREQCEKLMALGVREGQGYLFSKPLTSEQFVSYILTMSDGIAQTTATM